MPMKTATSSRRSDPMAGRTYFIGRGKGNDIRLTDPTVSRRHAELVVTKDGRYYLTDCVSSHGTHVVRDHHWVAVRQAFVAEDDQLRFGDHRAGIRELLAGVSQRAGGASGQDGGRIDRDNLPSGPVMRNPQTGEVQGAGD